jgi:hypothetical protein
MGFRAIVFCQSSVACFDGGCIISCDGVGGGTGARFWAKAAESGNSYTKTKTLMMDGRVLKRDPSCAVMSVPHRRM